MMEQRYCKVAGWTLICGLALVLFPVTHIDFGVDSTTYFRRAIDLATSFKYTNAYRGPVFPALAATAIFFTDATSQMVLMVPRIAYAFAIIGMAGLTWRMYGFLPSLFATVYFALSPLIHQPGARFHIDIFVVVFSIWALWIFYAALSRRSTRLAIASGILLAIAFLTKEVVILLVPFWGMAWLGFHEDRRRALRLSGYSFLSAIAVILPWFLLVTLMAGPSSVFGVVASSQDSPALLHKITDAPVAFLMQAPGKVWQFIEVYFIEFRARESGPYSYLALAAFLWVLIRYLRFRQQRDFFALLLVLCFIPLMLFLEETRMHARQAAIIFSMFAVSVAGLGKSVWDGVVWTSRRVFKSEATVSSTAWNGCVTLLIFSIVLMHLSVNTPLVRRQFSPGPMSYALFAGSEDWFQPSGLYNPQLVEAGRWARKHLEKGKTIMAAYTRNALILKLLFTDMTVNSIGWNGHNLKSWREWFLQGAPEASSVTAMMGEKVWPDNPGNLIFLGGSSAEEKLSQCLLEGSIKSVRGSQSGLFFLHESTLLSQIEQKNTQFVLVSNEMSFLSRYFDANPMFEHVYTANLGGPIVGREEDAGAVRVYEVHDREALDSYVPTVARQVFKLLRLYAEKYPQEYSVWRSRVLMEGMGLTEEQVAQIEQGNAGCVMKACFGCAARPCK